MSTAYLATRSTSLTSGLEARWIGFDERTHNTQLNTGPATRRLQWYRASSHGERTTASEASPLFRIVRATISCDSTNSTKYLTMVQIQGSTYPITNSIPITQSRFDNFSPLTFWIALGTQKAKVITIVNNRYPVNLINNGGRSVSESESMLIYTENKGAWGGQR